MNQKKLIKYIKGFATQPEKEQVLEWVKADIRNEKELYTLRKIYDITVWKKEAIHIGNRQIKNKLYKFSAVAAAIMVLLATNGYIYLLQNKKRPVIMQSIRVPAGQRAQLTLTDGTDVWLNAGSTLIFPNNFESGKREVTLDGEAYFRVEKEKEPFIVITEKMDIEVSGTEFNVLAYNESELFEVSLLRGKVMVCSEGKKIGLKPDEKIYLCDSQLVKQKIQNYDYLLWKDGVISFDDEPVNQVINKLELYFDTKIIVENRNFMEKKYTGKFRTKDGIEHILKVFQLKECFLYEKDDENNRIIIK